MSNSTSTRRAPRRPPGLAGGHVAKVDRVEWVAMPEQRQAINALIAGEIDLIEAPSHDLLPLEKAQCRRQAGRLEPLGNQYAFRFNQQHKPFDNPKVRQALWEAFNQKDFLHATIGDPTYYKVCKAMFLCGTAAGDRSGMQGKARIQLPEGARPPQGGRL